MEPNDNQPLPDSLKRQLNIIILQFLRELNLMDASHQMERDFDLYFDSSYFTELIRKGSWDELDHYVSGFTSPNNNDSSWKLFFKIRRQKYLEALQRSDREQAKTIFENELAVIIGARMDLANQQAAQQYVPNCMSHLLDPPQIDVQASRNTLVGKLTELVNDNPDLSGKFVLPEFRGRLKEFATQCLEAQFSKCSCSIDAWALLHGHQCPQQSDRSSPVDNVHEQNGNQVVPSSEPRDLEVPPVSPPSNGVENQPVSSRAVNRHTPARTRRRRLRSSASTRRPERTSATNVPSSSTVPQEGTSTSVEATALTRKNIATEVDQPTSHSLNSSSAGASSSPAPVVNVARKEVVSRPAQEAETSVVPTPEISNSHVAQPSGPKFSFSAGARRRRTPRVEVSALEAVQGNASSGSGVLTVNELPCRVVRTLQMGSSKPRSLDFHPLQQELLLVGMMDGGLIIWSVKDGMKLLTREFEIWNQQGGLTNSQEDLMVGGKSVNQVRWSQDGMLAGIAYTNGRVQLFKFLGRDILRPHLQIKAHSSNVNDIAFAVLDDRLVFVTGGDDKEVKAWDATSGDLIRSFQGHEASVHCVHAYRKGLENYILSTSLDGKLKVWSFEIEAAISEHHNESFASVQHSSDGARLFSCAVTRRGKCIVTQLEEPGYNIVRTYLGLSKHVHGSKVHFHTAKNRFLAVGHESVVKFWDMEDSDMLRSTDQSIGLEMTPIVRFNKDGSLLAATANNCQIKIFASADGVSLVNDQDTWNGGQSTEVDQNSQLSTLSQGLVDLNSLPDIEP